MPGIIVPEIDVDFSIGSIDVELEYTENPIDLEVALANSEIEIPEIDIEFLIDPIEIVMEYAEAPITLEVGLAMPGPPGPPGDVVYVVETYTHNQIVASATWVIDHPLKKFPSVTIIDSSGDVVEGDINYVSSDRVVASFIGAFGGIAHLN